MTMKRKLFMAVGPLVVAVVVLLGLLFLPVTILPTGQKQINNSATAISTNIMKGEKVYQAAMEEKRMIPFFGSSELSRFDAFHPSVLAEKYDRNYTPYLIGNAGSQSLTHFLAMEGMGESLTNKKAVFIISPQWFVKGGAPSMMFDSHFSPLQTYEFILSDEVDSPQRRYAAERFLEYKAVCSDQNMEKMLHKIEKGESITKGQKGYAKLKRQVLRNEDKLFGAYVSGKNAKKVQNQLKNLPNTYDNEQLDQKAYEVGKKSSTNNPYQIKNGFYKTRIQPIEGELAGSQKTFDYEFSKEFSDFQVVLDKMEANNMNVRFVIPPVNQKWLKYTGLSQEMLNNFSKKITHQLTSQGFQVIDLSGDGSEDYFMQDTIHIGWRGWVALDKQLDPFLSAEKPDKSKITLNNYFLSKEWQDLPAKDIPTK